MRLPTLLRLLTLISSDLTLVSMVLRLLDLKETIVFIAYRAGTIKESVKHVLHSNTLIFKNI